MIPKYGEVFLDDLWGCQLAASGDIKDGFLLIRAVCAGQVEQAAAQLAAGDPLDVVDSDARTALMWAASMGSKELVAMLIKAGADPNQANSHRSRRPTASARASLPLPGAAHRGR